MVRFSNASIVYSGKAILSGLNLDLTAPNHHAIMGMSGGGKSTILKAILSAYLEKTDQGLPSLQGRVDIDRNLRISYLPQECGLASWLTLRKNIILGRQLREGRHAKSLGPTGERLVASLRLEPWLEKTPSAVSVGTIRRAALARALITHPDLLLLDEPFAGLDFDIREQVITMLLAEFDIPQRLIVFVTHEPYEAAQTSATVHILPSSLGGLVRTVNRTDRSDCDVFQRDIRKELNKSLKHGELS